MLKYQPLHFRQIVFEFKYIIMKVTVYFERCFQIIIHISVVLCHTYTLQTIYHWKGHSLNHSINSFFEIIFVREDGMFDLKLKIFLCGVLINQHFNFWNSFLSLQNFFSLNSKTLSGIFDRLYTTLTF